jgi:UDP-2-acetamido-2,6-beta-L-arabino-hexul-4-ose reductase
VQRVVVTGATGFIGRNLMVALGRVEGVHAAGFDQADSRRSLMKALLEAHVVFHLAGVNRPPDTAEFHAGNVGFTEDVCGILRDAAARPVIVLSSSTQAELDNPYGRSKRAAEGVLTAWAGETGGDAVIYRLPNVFGKWGRPNYNSVVITFCHNVAHGIPIRVDNPDAPMTLVHVDDVVAEFLRVLDAPPEGLERRTVSPLAHITVGQLAARVRAFRAAQHSPDLPDLSAHFDRALFSTYLSYLDPIDLVFGLASHADERGDLAELLREHHAGQVFVSHTIPGVTRGNHYHNRKTERFMVICGEGLIRLRRLATAEVLEYRVGGTDPKAVIIPPGTVHSIENVGRSDMITLFWASDVLDPARPDTYHEPVLLGEEEA